MLTGGGDCPGLNAVIRAVVRKGEGTYGHQIVGFRHGWRGLVDDETVDLTLAATRGILRQGGTILGSSRTNPFKQEGDVAAVLHTLERERIDALVAIGGEDTLGVAHLLAAEGVRCIGVPKTIDNDLSCTDITFGFDTAVQIASDALDRLHTTAESHDRVLVVEVMGRHAGFIAEAVGFACGAEAILTPERPTDLAALHKMLDYAAERGKKSCIVVVAEGDDAGSAFEVQRKLNLGPEHHVRVTVLGHVQRGGSPTAFDRILAGRLGHAAVCALLEGKRNVMAGIVADRVVFTALEETVTRRKESPANLLEIAAVLAT